MATTNVSSMDWTPIELKYLNGNLSQSAQGMLDEVSAGGEPDYFRKVSWTDLYSIFQNSRWLVRESKKLASPLKTGDLVAMSEVMQDNHRFLRGYLLLLAIENLLHIGHLNAFAVLWEYGNQIALAEMISRELARPDEKVKVQALVEANLLAVI